METVSIEKRLVWLIGLMLILAVSAGFLMGRLWEMKEGRAPIIIEKCSVTE